jgi:hypothetical protein
MNTEPRALPERLRDRADTPVRTSPGTRALLHEAADEIEQLRATVAFLRGTRNHPHAGVSDEH